MNTLDDLRRTLDQHAEDVADPAAVARTAAVHHRVAVVRRRRAAGAGALALVVLAGLAAVLVPRVATDSLPAAPVVLGDKAPTTEHSLGYTYRTDGSAESGARHVQVSVSGSDEPQLYSWTTDGAQNVRVVLPGEEVVHSQLTGFHDFVVLPPGTRGELTLQVARGQVGLARYTLTSTAPVGDTRAGITFRQNVAGTPLLGAVLAAPGATDVTTTMVAPQGQAAFALLCTGLPPGDDIQVTFDGRTGLGGGCQDGPAFDPGADPGYTTRMGTPGRKVTVRVFVSKGLGSSTAVTGPLPHLQIGLGVYAPLSQQRLAGYEVPTSLERDGHLWQLDRTYRSPGAPLRMPASRQDRVAMMVWSARGTVKATFSAQGSTPVATEVRSAAGGAGGTGGLWAPAGATMTASTAHDKGPFGVALYTRAD